jgi:2-keto-4-pentenoate hydratase/2-oxohepta-3-ene-1,7-dioic acid hydratase in catechol pathway
VKLCRFNDDRLGVIEGDEVLDVSAALEVLPAVRWPYPAGDAICTHWATIRPAIEAATPRADRHDLAAVALRSPVANPGKIIGIARNRKSLEAENLNFGTISANTRKDSDPIFMFIKANSALAGSSDGVQLRFTDRRNDPEAELTIVIGTGGTDIAYDDALDHVLGYTIGIDMTLRGKESQSSRKSIDSYALIGPCVATLDEIPDPDSLGFSLSINGAEIQRSNTSELAFDIRSLIAHASTFYTLLPGDIIMAGTPVGFEPVHAGDTMDVDFEGIGSMRIAITAHR